MDGRQNPEAALALGTLQDVDLEDPAIKAAQK
jgi:hypothetical protein